MSHCHTIIDQLRQRGYRITPQRELIIQVISHSPNHMTAEEIHSEMRKFTQTMNIATVYRTLEMLWEEGFACRNDLSEGKIVYATFKHGPHTHLVCRLCNHVIDADPNMLEPLGDELQSQFSFRSDLQHLSIFGLCNACQV